MQYINKEAESRNLPSASLFYDKGENYELNLINKQYQKKA